MFMLTNKSVMEGINSNMFYKEESTNRIVTDGNNVNLIAQKAIGFGTTYFGRACYPEFTLTEERKSFSKSLTDLTGMERMSKSVEREVVVRNLFAKAFPNGQFPWTESRIAKEAGRRITHMLILHAWRCQRLGAQQSRTLVDALNNKVESLNMQVYVLRQLLKSEETKRNLTVKEMQAKKLESEHERDVILKEKEMLERNVKELLHSVMKLKDESENQKNNFKAAKIEAENWEVLHKKEKENAKILKDQRVALEQEIQGRDEKIAQQTWSLKELNRRKVELEEELDAHMVILNETMEQINSVQEKLKLSEELREQQKRFLMEKNEEINQLRAQIALMEEKLQEQDERNGELGKLISEKTKELILLHDKLGELTKNQRFWGNRAVKMVSLCTRIPIACFYTVATLLLPQPSYHSM